jgi:hypothetical protein
MFLGLRPKRHPSKKKRASFCISLFLQNLPGGGTEAMEGCFQLLSADGYPNEQAVLHACNAFQSMCWLGELRLISHGVNLASCCQNVVTRNVLHQTQWCSMFWSPDKKSIWLQKSSQHAISYEKHLLGFRCPACAICPFNLYTEHRATFMD